MTDGSDWEEYFRRSVNGYRDKEGREITSPFKVMYGTSVRVMNDEEHRKEGSIYN